MSNYVHESLQRTFDYLLADQESTAALTSALTDAVKSEPIEPVGGLPYLRLVNDALRQINEAAIVTSPVGIQHKWGRDDIKFNAPAGITHTSVMLQVVEQLYTEHAGVPQLEETVAASLDVATRHMVGFARLGAGIEDSSFAQAQGIDPNGPNAPKLRRGLFTGTGMTPVTPLTYAVRNIEGQVHVRPLFRNTRTGKGSHCPAADTLVIQEGRQVPALYNFLRIMGSVAASTIYPRSFVIVRDGSQEASSS